MKKSKLSEAQIVAIIKEGELGAFTLDELCYRLTVKAERCLPAQKVTLVLDELAEVRGYPKKIRTDNGPEYISKIFSVWAAQHKIELSYIQLGKPAQNAYIERFNRTYREEVLDMHIFETLAEVEKITASWVYDYNNKRPHDSLANATPENFAESLGVPPGTLRECGVISNTETITNSTYERF